MINRIFAIMCFAVIALLAGCASVPMAPQSEDAALKAFAPPSGENAGLYIYRNSFVGQALKKNVYVDGEFLGESANKVYFHKEVAPGKHTISTESEFSDNALAIEVKAGVNYFIRQYIKMGVFVGGAGVELVPEEEGKKQILESRLAK